MAKAIMALSRHTRPTAQSLGMQCSINVLIISTMKTRFLFTVIFLLIIQEFYGQNYSPLAVEGAHWIVRLDLMETIYPVDGLWEYYSNGDTIINDTSYKKIYYRDLQITENGPPFQATGIYSLFGFVRDDSINKKVYTRVLNTSNDCPANEDYLLFDFNLQIGDTARFCIRPTFYNFIVQDIYTTGEFGFYTKAFMDSEGDQLYEGIGSNYGLFEQMLAPFKKNNEKYILHTFLYYYCRESPCSLLVSSTLFTESSVINFSPNPAKTSISLIGDKKREINSVRIYNQLGQVQLRILGRTEIIDVSKLKKGIYFVELASNENSIIKKLVIE